MEIPGLKSDIQIQSPAIFSDDYLEILERVFNSDKPVNTAETEEAFDESFKAYLSSTDNMITSINSTCTTTHPLDMSSNLIPNSSCSTGQILDLSSNLIPLDNTSSEKIILHGFLKVLNNLKMISPEKVVRVLLIALLM